MPAETDLLVASVDFDLDTVREREFFIDNLLVRIHFIMEKI